ncbi:hypothetical protein PSZ46_23300, partial [Shigella flexneri]|nr:hypothetical protein [Shigella flexneri]
RAHLALLFWPLSCLPLNGGFPGARKEWPGCPGTKARKEGDQSDKISRDLNSLKAFREKI